jgi:hypothetical protein
VLGEAVRRRHGGVDERARAGDPAGAEDFDLRLHETEHVEDGVARLDVASLRIDNDLDVVVVDRGEKDEFLGNLARDLLADLAEDHDGAGLEEFLLDLALGLLFLLLFLLGRIVAEEVGAAGKIHVRQHSGGRGGGNIGGGGVLITEPCRISPGGYQHSWSFRCGYIRSERFPIPAQPPSRLPRDWRDSRCYSQPDGRAWGRS